VNLGQLLLMFAMAALLSGPRCGGSEVPKPHLYALSLPQQCSDAGFLVHFDSETNVVEPIRTLPLPDGVCFASTRPREFLTCCVPFPTSSLSECLTVATQRLRDTEVHCEVLVDESGAVVGRDRTYVVGAGN